MQAGQWCHRCLVLDIKGGQVGRTEVHLDSAVCYWRSHSRGHLRGQDEAGDIHFATPGPQHFWMGGLSCNRWPTSVNSGGDHLFAVLS